MDRRNFMAASAAGIALAMTKAVAEEGHHHASAPKAASKLDPNKLQTLRKEVGLCLKSAQNCVGLCNQVVASGDASMANCQAAVLNLISVSRALEEVLAWNTASDQNVKTLASTCAAYCADCSTACAEHASHHKECKECKQACDSCKKACDAITA